MLPGPRVICSHASYRAVTSCALRTTQTSPSSKRHLSLGQPIVWAEQWFLDFHQLLGEPRWGATIVLATVLLRGLFSVPLGIRSHVEQARRHLIKPHLRESQFLIERISHARATEQKWSEAERERRVLKALRQRETDILGRFGLHSTPWILLAPVLQAPFLIYASLGLRKMSGMTYWVGSVAPNGPIDGFETGGWLWFTALTVPDTTMIFPVATTAANLLLFEMQLRGMKHIAEKHPTSTWLWRIALVAVGGILNFMPMSVNLFALVSTLVGGLQHGIFLLPVVRRRLLDRAAHLNALAFRRNAPQIAKTPEEGKCRQSAR